MTSLHDCSARAGENLFEELYTAHKPAVHRAALHLLGNQQDAEEITQETFLSAYRALADGTSPKAPRAWLLAIARNACRARWRSSGYPAQEVPLEDKLAVAFNECEISEAGEVRAALEHLRPSQRMALVLRDLLGLSFAEIATRLGLSESAVHTLLFRARATMREELEAERSPLSCGEAETLLVQRSAAMTRLDRSLLRTHLRHCAACAVEARRRRARHATLGLFAAPLQKLTSWLGLSSTAAPGAKLGVLIGAAALAAVATQAGSTGLSPPKSAQAPGTALVSAAGLESEPLPAGIIRSDPRPNSVSREHLDEVSGQAPSDSTDRADGSQTASPSPAEPNAAELASVRSESDSSRGTPRGATRLADRQNGGPTSPPAIAQVLPPETTEPLNEALTGVVSALSQVTVPEIVLPESAGPEAAVPEITMPEVTVPEVTVTVTVPVTVPAVPVPATESLLPQLPSLD